MAADRYGVVTVAAKHAARGHEAALREAQTMQQRGECPLCNGKLVKANAASDHCHRTGLPRQTLCRRCNSALGTLETRGEPAALALLAAGRKKPQQILAAMRAYMAAWAGRHAELVQRTEGRAIGTKQAAAVALVWALDDLMKYSASTTDAMLRTDAGKARARAMFAGLAAGLELLK